MDEVLFSKLWKNNENPNKYEVGLFCGISLNYSGYYTLRCTTRNVRIGHYKKLIENELFYCHDEIIHHDSSQIFIKQTLKGKYSKSSRIISLLKSSITGIEVNGQYRDIHLSNELFTD